MYQNQYSIINSSININLQELQVLNSVQKALENIEMIKSNETLQNLGSDFYIRSRVVDGKSVLVGVGAGYVIEKSIGEAEGYANSLIERKRNMINRLAKNKSELEAAIVELTYRIDALGHRV